MAERPLEKSTKEARQGERGRPVLLVLSISMALVVCAFIVLGVLSSDGDLFSIGIVDNTEAPTAPAGEAGRDAATGSAYN